MMDHRGPAHQNSAGTFSDKNMVIDVRFVSKKFAGQTPAVNHKFVLTGTGEACNNPQHFFALLHSLTMAMSPLHVTTTPSFKW
jgi:hypothetical protein